MCTDLVDSKHVTKSNFNQMQQNTVLENPRICKSHKPMFLYIFIMMAATRVKKVV